MWDLFLIYGLIILVTLGIAIFIIYLISKEHKSFIKNAQQLHNGMHRSEALNLMGNPTVQEIDNDREILIWEKPQWVGVPNGGTIVRSIKVVIVQDKIISLSTKNFDEPII